MSDYHLFDTFQDAVLVIDGEGRVFFGNSAAALLFEVSVRRMSSGKALGQFVAFDPDPIAEAGSMASIVEATQVREVGFTSSSGKAGWAQVTIQPQPEFFTNDPEERTRWIVCLRDVSLEKTLHDKYKAELDKKEVVIRDLEVARAKLEDYSHNLEKMVEARTAEVVAMNRLLKAILDSLGQGILVFDQMGACMPVFSKVCKKILEKEPVGRTIEEVLSLAGEDRDSLISWREAVFGEMLDFDELVPLAPSSYRHSAGLSIALGFNPMRGEDGRIQGVVMVATDRTREEEALREAARERDLVRRVVQVARHKESFRMFAEDTQKFLSELAEPQKLERTEFSRRLHTIKGGAATFALSAIASACHEFEDKLKTKYPESADVTDEAAASPCVWQGPEFTQEVAAFAGEIRSQLEGAIESLSELLGPLSIGGSSAIEIPRDRFLQWSQWSQQLLSAATVEEAWALGREIFSECTEKPLATSITHLESSLQELAANLGKKFSALKIEGSEVRGPAEQLQPLLSSLVHAFRNSIDHGLENPDVRLSQGKPEAGEICVKFAREINEGDESIVIDIRDDGRGVDADRVRAKLQKIGKPELAEAPDEEVIQAILRDDFSTTEAVTEISGRGVGLGAIAAEAKRLGGIVRVESEAGRGMRLFIRVPMAKVVMPTLLQAS